MRLREIVDALHESAIILSRNRSIDGASPIGGNQAHKLSGITGEQLRWVAFRLRPVPHVGDLAKAIAENRLVHDTPDKANPTGALGTNAVPQLESLLQSTGQLVNTLIQAFEPLAPETPERYVLVTAPEDVHDLQSLARFATEVDEALGDAALVVVGEKLQLSAVDRGSIVFELVALTSAVFAFTRVLIAGCNKALAEADKARASVEHLKSLGVLQNELAETLREQLRQYRRALAEGIDQGFDDVHPPGHSHNEASGRILHSMDKLMGLLERGAKIQALAPKVEPGVEDELIKKLPEMAIKLLAAKTGGVPDAE